MKQITEQYIDSVNKDIWSKAIAEHGTAYRVPNEVAQEISDIGRGLYVLQSWQNKGSIGSPLASLSHHNIMPDIAEKLLLEHLGHDVKKNEKKDGLTSTSTKTKMEKLVSNAEKNYSKTFTTEQLCEVSGFSAQTVVKHLKIMKHYRRVKRGLYEAQNPKTV